MKSLTVGRFALYSLVVSGLLALVPSGYSQLSNYPPAVYIFSPTNNSMVLAPANMTIYARAIARTGTVQTVEFFANNASLGLVVNAPGVQVTNGIPEPAFPMGWSNVLAGSYGLKAVVTDSQGMTATSAVVNVNVVTNFPPPPVIRPYVYIYSPTNTAKYLAPANLNIYVRAGESNTGVVQTVEFFAGHTSLGVVPNSSQVAVTSLGSGLFFPLAWTNVPMGSYELHAVATDAIGVTATSTVVAVSVVTNMPPPPVVAPYVYIYSPTNNAKFVTPANVMIYARAGEANSGVVQTVQFFAGDTSLGIVPNSSQVAATNIGGGLFFPLAWTGVPVGHYGIKAIAKDAVGVTGTSTVVNITVETNLPPPVIPFAVGFYYPTNGQSFKAPASIGLHTCVVDSNVVQTVQYYAGDTSIGIVSNTSGVLLTNSTSGNPFFLSWPNVPAGSYALKAIATDSAGLTATSAPVNVSVLLPPPVTNRPPEVRIVSPPNAAVFRTPVNLPVYAYAHDPDGYVTSVEFFNGTNSLGLGNPVSQTTNSAAANTYSNFYYTIVWSNAPLGEYTLSAVACDNSNNVASSLPVRISILPPPPPPTNHAAVVSIVAIDPVAIEGTNVWVYPGRTNSVGTWTNWSTGTAIPITNCGPKNATFSVYRSGDTNTSITVAYSIAGTASNGVDYVALGGAVTIGAGQRQGLIPVVPIDDGLIDGYRSVILKLTPSTNTPALYVIGSPCSAAAIIVDSTSPRPATGTLSDKVFHVNADGPDGAWFHVDYSTDMIQWTSVCTNQVVNGSIDFVDPDASTVQSRFYRAVPQDNPAQQ